MKWLKITYIISTLTALLSGGIMIYGLYNQLYLMLTMVTPLFAISYPLFVVGSIIYGIKKLLERKSPLELLTGGSVNTGMPDFELGEEEESEEDKDE